MRKLVGYISGSISEHLYTGKNEALFREVEQQLEKFGYETLVPHDIEALDGWDGKWEMHMRADLAEMLLKADFVVTLPHSENSDGTYVESWLARKMRIPVIPLCNLKSADVMVWPEDSVFRRLEVSHG